MEWHARELQTMILATADQIALVRWSSFYGLEHPLQLANCELLDRWIRESFGSRTCSASRVIMRVRHLYSDLCAWEPAKLC